MYNILDTPLDMDIEPNSGIQIVDFRLAERKLREYLKTYTFSVLFDL